MLGLLRRSGASLRTSTTLRTSSPAALSPVVGAVVSASSSTSLGAKRHQSSWHQVWPHFKVTGKMRMDNKRRQLVQEYELERRLYKSMVHNQHLEPAARAMAQHKLSTLPRNSSMTRVRNRCIVTGRSRSVYRWARMSRLTIREMIAAGLFPGWSKSSW